MGEIEDRCARAVTRRPAVGVDEREAIAAVEREQQRQALREGRPEAIALAMAEAGLVSMPLVEGAYRIGAKRVVDEQAVDLWYAVQTAPQMELKVKEGFGNLGLHCYVPIRTFWRQLRRRVNGNPDRRRIEAPLCPGYAFLGLPVGDPDWRTIRGLDGVVNVVGYAGRPHPIRQTIKLYAIMQAEKAGEFDLAREIPDAPDWEVRPGEPVRVTSGPFEGFIARIREGKGDVVKIVIDALFGGSVVHVKKHDLEPVCA